MKRFQGQHDARRARARSQAGAGLPVGEALRLASGRVPTQRRIRQRRRRRRRRVLSSAASVLVAHAHMWGTATDQWLRNRNPETGCWRQAPTWRRDRALRSRSRHMDDLTRFLRPAGGGIYTVSTGRAEQEALQRRLYDARDADEVQRKWQAALAGVGDARVGDPRHPVRLRRGAGARRGVRARGRAARAAGGVPGLRGARGARGDRRRRRRVRGAAAARRRHAERGAAAADARRALRTGGRGRREPAGRAAVDRRARRRRTAGAQPAACASSCSAAITRSRGRWSRRWRGTCPSRGRSCTSTRTRICCPSGWACGSASRPGRITPTSCSGGAGGWCRSACARRRDRSSTGSRRWACASSGPTRCARAATAVIDDVIAHLRGAGRRARLPLERHRRDRQRGGAVDGRAGGERACPGVRARADRARRARRSRCSAATWSRSRRRSAAPRTRGARRTSPPGICWRRWRR